jgi:hypothetical protein
MVSALEKAIAANRRAIQSIDRAALAQVTPCQS